MGMRMMFKEGYHRQLTLARKREIMRIVQANKARISKTETTINSQSIKGHRTIRWDGKMGNKLIMDNKLMGMSNKGSSQTSQEYRKYSQISGITLTKMQSLNSSTQIKGEMLGDKAVFFFQKNKILVCEFAHWCAKKKNRVSSTFF